MAGVAADLVGFLIYSFGGPYHPGLTISMGLTGLIPGLLLHSTRNELTVLQEGLIVLLTDLIAGVLLNTLWLSQMFGGGFFELLGMRLVARLLTLPMFTDTVYWDSRAYRFFLAGGSR